MKHLDLFSGIGGFAYALDNIFYENKIKHTFVEWDEFCKAVLKKHWPSAEIHGDIREFIAYSGSLKSRRLSDGEREKDTAPWKCDFLTGGVPVPAIFPSRTKEGNGRRPLPLAGDA